MKIYTSSSFGYFTAYIVFDKNNIICVLISESNTNRKYNHKIWKLSQSEFEEQLKKNRSTYDRRNPSQLKRSLNSKKVFNIIFTLIFEDD